MDFTEYAINCCNLKAIEYAVSHGRDLKNYFPAILESRNIDILKQ